MQPTPDQLARFREVSPIAHVDRVQAPLLFMLGAKDRRCDSGKSEESVVILVTRDFLATFLQVPTREMSLVPSMLHC